MPGAGVTGFVPQQFKPHIHSVQRAAQLMSQARNQRPQPGQPIRRIERGLEFFDGREIPDHDQQPGRYSLAAQAEERNQEGAARRQRQRHVVRFGARRGGLDQSEQWMVRTQHRSHRGALERSAPGGEPFLRFLVGEQYDAIGVEQHDGVLDRADHVEQMRLIAVQARTVRPDLPR